MESSEVVVLRNGMVVSLAALRLGWALEDRGLRLDARDDGLLRVSPHASLTTEDVRQIRRHRDELFALARYDADATRA